MRPLRACLFAACCFASSACASGQAQTTPAPPEPAPAAAPQQTTAPPRTIEETVESTATITAIDMANREVTLKNEDGESTKIVVGPEMERFDELAVGDTVRARYTIGMTAELRAPTEEEKAEPFIALESGGKSPAGTAPAAGAARMFRIVATIEALDRTTQTATLKGPDDTYLTVKVRDPSLLVKPRIGDTVVVTVAESMALSLEKVAK